MAWSRRDELGLPAFYMRADPQFLADRAARLGLSVPIRTVEPGQTLDAFAEALPVVPTGAPVADRPGEAQADTGAAVISSIEAAVADVRQGVATAVVTNPIHKKVLYDAGFRHPGHTEFLGVLAEQWGPGPWRPVMMLAGPSLMVVPVTTHIALRRVPDVLTTDLIVETGHIVARDLKVRFGIAAPRLSVAGLNPHAGEGGTMGIEDETVVAPAVARLRAEGIDARGPFPADTLFHPAARREYDCVLGMYHDQALIPVKTIAFDETVNVTLGLPFVRTSPDHGTAFPIAGTGTARPDSFAASVRLAAALGDPSVLT
ncbi:4-hydroxythreonine-4-phosphate dehydrogenase protein [Polymorphum gilvum SL003B-26A1]|uniref:4-hydroxythreonine-4-phosphate dehydrogenase protein n=2 Tax=Polymorphum TaxID=991903 RepID=F2J1M1_POLGS|nr:4-hydroxythreonine-4-phosphate dehydrogenase protein [Polymorphum gilvum SL003B-26A1]